ncbi:MAG: LptA/OstA family protein [Candidatus Fermentibacter sp.]|nr:LptA/OstA family protein [Candidatus Fermentibacter sp.]
MRSSLLALAASTAALAGVFTVSAARASGSETGDGELVVDLGGDVEVTDGFVSVTADSGRVWQQAGRALFLGNVEIESDTLEGSASRLLYDRTAGTAVLTGNVELTDGSNVLRAEEVTWFRLLGKAVARGGVHMTGPWVGDVTGEYAMYDSGRGSIFVTSEPVLRRFEEGDSLVITADRLEFLPDSDRAEAQGNAVLDYPSEGVTAVSEFLVYSGLDETVEMLGGPVVTEGENRLSGNWMKAELDGGEIRSIRIEGAADGYIVDTGETPPSETWFSSESAYFAFAGGEPDSVDLMNSVTLVYRAGGEAAAREESNTVSGQHLVVRYESGSVESVCITGSATGSYSYLGDGL